MNHDQQTYKALWTVLRPLDIPARIETRRRMNGVAARLAARSLEERTLGEATERARARLVRYAVCPPVTLRARIREALAGRLFGDLRDAWPDGGERLDVATLLEGAPPMPPARPVLPRCRGEA